MSETSLCLLLVVVAGNVRRHERLSDDDAARSVDRCLKRIERVVALFDGRLLRAGNGEAMAAFFEATAALQAAREMLHSVGELPPASGVVPALRVGLAYGELAADDGGERCAAGDGVQAVAARLSGLAEPGQLLLCAATQLRLAPTELALTREVATAGDSALRVFALDSAPAATPAASILRLRYSGNTYLIDATTRRLRIGRDADNDVEVGDRRASRRHATIERRGATFFLIDHSSNGSYVTPAGQGELLVRSGEMVLAGAGVICFAAPAASAGVECAQFEVIGAVQQR